MTKLNPLFSNRNNLSLMREAIYDTRYSGQEIGYDLCADKDNNISLENICFGDSCSIIFEDRCSKDKKLVGNFHTHPIEADTSPSIDDLMTSYARGVGCIGRAKTLDIMCINRKEEFNINDFEALLSIRNSKNAYIKRNIEQLKNKLFDTRIFNLTD